MKHLAIILMFLIGSSGLAQMYYAEPVTLTTEYRIPSIADTVWLTKDSVQHVKWLPMPDSILVGDANSSGYIDIDDVLYLLKYIYSDTIPPPVYRSIDTYFKHTEACGVVLDETGWPIDFIYRKTGESFGRVSGQEWRDSL